MSKKPETITVLMAASGDENHRHQPPRIRGALRGVVGLTASRIKPHRPEAHARAPHTEDVSVGLSDPL